MVKQMELLYERSVANHAKGDQLDLSKLNYIATAESKAAWNILKDKCKGRFDSLLNIILSEQNIRSILFE